MGVPAMDPTKEALSTKVWKNLCAPLKTHLKLPAEVIDRLGTTVARAGLESPWPRSRVFPGKFRQGKCLL